MKNVKQVGFWTAILAAIFGSAYSIAELLNTFGHVFSFPENLIWLFTPSLFLAPAFLITMICAHYFAPSDKKIWTAIGIAFAIVYATLISMVYFSQLSVIIPQLMDGSIDENNVLIFKTGSFLLAVDCLGYVYMGLSTLFASFAFKGSKDNKWLFSKWLFIGMFWNGLVAPISAIIIFYPEAIYIGAMWIISFPMAMINLSKMFKKNSNNLK